MRTTARIAVLAVLCAAAPSLAFAQRFAFERTLQTPVHTKLDVATVRGKIEVVAGAPGKIVVEGVATVRVGWSVPSNAVELARQVAASPPIEHVGDTIKLRIPADDSMQRAVTISYRVQVPPDTEVVTSSDSGATSIRGVAGSVSVRTQSAAIAVERLAGASRIATGSGAVTADDMTGPLDVSTSSSAFTGTRLAAVRVRTQSGAVRATQTRPGDVEVETGSSAITLLGVRGALAVRTQSGSVTVEGSPVGPWAASTGSSSVTLDLDSQVGFQLDAVTRSSSIVVEGGTLQGSATKQSVKGTVNGGGALVKVTTGNGSIRVRLRG